MGFVKGFFYVRRLHKGRKRGECAIYEEKIKITRSIGCYDKQVRAVFFSGDRHPLKWFSIVKCFGGFGLGFQLQARDASATGTSDFPRTRRRGQILSLRGRRIVAGTENHPLLHGLWRATGSHARRVHSLYCAGERKYCAIPFKEVFQSHLY